MHTQLFRFLTGLIALVFAHGALGAAVIYTDQASFNGAVGAGLVIEDFDDETTGGTPPGPLNLIGTDLQSITTTALQIFRIDSPGGVSGQGLSVQSTGTYSATFNFAHDQRAFGLHILDLFEASASQRVDFSTNAGDSGTLLAPGVTLGNLNLQFLGFTTDTGFSSVTLTMVNAFNDGSEWDTISFAQTNEAVPAPLGIGLVLTGLALVLRRR